jgi:hypothetical protein
MASPPNYEGGCSLGRVIFELERMPPEGKPSWGFKEPHSYRGYYECLAFRPAEDRTVGEMLADAKSAVGSFHEGYKGGWFEMELGTECYLANWGDTGVPLTLDFFDYMWKSLRKNLRYSPSTVNRENPQKKLKKSRKKRWRRKRQ